jgi:magnesium transporter
VVFKDCILTFHNLPVPHPSNVIRRINQVKTYGLRVTADWINYAIIDDITDGFMPVLKFIEFEVDAIDDLVLILKESEQSDMLRRIGHARKKVLLLLRLMSTKADVLKMILKRLGERMDGNDETCLYLGDIQGTYNCLMYRPCDYNDTKHCTLRKDIGQGTFQLLGADIDRDYAIIEQNE